MDRDGTFAHDPSAFGSVTHAHHQTPPTSLPVRAGHAQPVGGGRATAVRIRDGDGAACGRLTRRRTPRATIVTHWGGKAASSGRRVQAGTRGKVGTLRLGPPYSSPPRPSALPNLPSATCGLM